MEIGRLTLYLTTTRRKKSPEWSTESPKQLVALPLTTVKRLYARRVRHCELKQCKLQT